MQCKQIGISREYGERPSDCVEAITDFSLTNIIAVCAAWPLFTLCNGGGGGLQLDDGLGLMRFHRRAARKEWPGETGIGRRSEYKTAQTGYTSVQLLSGSESEVQKKQEEEEEENQMALDQKDET